jgi:predicted nucleic acid-binding protein
MIFSLDTNVVIDLLAGEISPQGSVPNWSIGMCNDAANRGSIIVSIIVYAEICCAFANAEIASQTLKGLGIYKVENPSLEALFNAGTAHAHYRRNGGLRERTLPDFIIGADALDRGATLITRDTARYQTYFPTLQLIAPPL